MADFSTLIHSIVKNNREPSWLKDYRMTALERFESTPTPLRTDEPWRRTDVSKLLVTGLEVDVLQASSSCNEKIWIPASPVSGSATALFTSAANQGVIFTTLSEAAQKVPDLVQKFLSADASETFTKFDHLSNALWNGGIFLYVPPNTKVSLPLSVFINPTTPNFFQKVLIVIDQNASANFWIDQASAQSHWIGSVTDVYLKEGANLSLLNVQRYSERATLLAGFNAYLERNAILDLMTVESGSALAKENWTVHLLGENAAAKAFGLVRATGKQHFDETLYVNHQKPRTQSEVLFKTVAADEARSIFTGLIHVQKEAQKTTAYQTNRNLLLSRQARADTIPKLEIEADDVKCGHGAAVSSIDEDQIYYLMSRGMTRDLAKAVIIEGFYADVLARWMKEDTLGIKDRDRLHDEVSQSIREILVGQSALYEAAVL